MKIRFYIFIKEWLRPICPPYSLVEWRTEANRRRESLRVKGWPFWWVAFKFNYLKKRICTVCGERHK